MNNAIFASLNGRWLNFYFQILLALLLLTNTVIVAATAASIAAIILPLSSTVWAPGKSATITYRISGSPDNTSYEINLMTGEADNAQLVHVFDKLAVPTISGVNSVTVQVPATLPEGKYGVRLGDPNGSTWRYSQLFTVSKTAKSNDDAVNIPAPNTAASTSMAESKLSSYNVDSPNQEHAATSAATKPTLVSMAPDHSCLVALPALALVIVAATF
ncbi:hypothetical protein GGI21_000533 [Coemansia aciculifera]|nr:hypothetical protein GGI21_000533 [Coemansia aciculifera]